MPLTSNAAGVAPGRIEHDGKRRRHVAQESLGVGRRLSTLIADDREALAAVRSCSAFIQGNERRHGAHHDAQKST